MYVPKTSQLIKKRLPRDLSRLVLKYIESKFRGSKYVAIAGEYETCMLMPRCAVARCFPGACEGGHKELVELIIYRDGNDCDPNEGLRIACRYGHKLIVDYMISLGADDWVGGFNMAAAGGFEGLAEMMAPKCPNNSRFYSMFYACMGGNIKIINLVISMGIKNWNQGLEGACRKGHMEAVEFMISLGANDWNLGLYAACGGGHKSTAARMILHGANDWNWGLFYACKGGKKELVEFMISRGADNWNWGIGGACLGKHKEFVALMISRGGTKCTTCGKPAGDHL